MPNEAPDDRRAFTIQEFAKTYHLSVSRVYELLNDHTLNAVKCGDRTLILLAEANRFEAALTPAKFPARLREATKHASPGHNDPP